MKSPVLSFLMFLLFVSGLEVNGQPRDPVHEKAMALDRNQKTATRHATIAQQAIDAVNGAQFNTFLGLVSPYHQLHWISLPEKKATGALPSWTAISAFRDPLEGFRLTPSRVISGRHFAAVVGVVEGTNMKSLEGVPPSRKLLRTHALCLFYMRNGKIRNTLMYLGIDDMMRQARSVTSVIGLPSGGLSLATAPFKVSSALLGKMQESCVFASMVRLAGLSGDPGASDLSQRSFSTRDTASGTAIRIKALRRAFPDLRLRLDDFFAAGEYSVVLATFTGTLGSGIGLLKRTDRPVRTQIAVVMKVAGNRVESAEIFMDSRSIAAAVGLE